MKKIINIILGIWYTVTSFISPVWLTIVGLNITGAIYKYDYSMDEGTALILGLILLVLWLLFVLLPDVYFWKRITHENDNNRFVLLGISTVAVILSFALCGWDIVSFLTV